ncbi:Rz-like spanin [Pseudomonas phage phikF77]|uniref:Putative Rz1 protein n=1 Tax=Pseudomonas phage phikF77 TaxID=627480 RepID=C0MQH4_9CAUD|nr:Rz-like spanin [Pseudomonas phage phikF77]CAX63168.1 putative Rz1 protein [Pseudomonas phage phikF77]
MPWTRTARGLTGLCLLLSLAACVTAPAPAVLCEHPLIDPTTQAGLIRAVAAYQDALDLCNALNQGD